MGVVRNFKFGLQVNDSKSQPDDDKSSLKGAWSWHILEFWPPEISLQRLQLKSSNFVHELAAWSISFGMPDYPLIAHGQGHVTHIIILHPLKYLCMSYS